MIPEAKIRERLAILEQGRDSTCTCAATGHTFECEQGRLLMCASIYELKWVLGEFPKLDEQTDVLRAMQRARRDRSGGPVCGFQPPDSQYGPCTRRAGHEGPCAHAFRSGGLSGND